MRVFNKTTLRKFYEKHEDRKEQLLTWYQVYQNFYCQINQDF